MDMLMQTQPPRTKPEFVTDARKSALEKEFIVAAWKLMNDLMIRSEGHVGEVSGGTSAGPGLLTIKAGKRYLAGGRTGRFLVLAEIHIDEDFRRRGLFKIIETMAWELVNIHDFNGVVFDNVINPYLSNYLERNTDYVLFSPDGFKTLYLDLKDPSHAARITHRTGTYDPQGGRYSARGSQALRSLFAKPEWSEDAA